VPSFESPKSESISGTDIRSLVLNGYSNGLSLLNPMQFCTNLSKIAKLCRAKLNGDYTCIIEYLQCHPNMGVFSRPLSEQWIESR
jgi:hypothetical protein